MSSTSASTNAKLPGNAGASSITSGRGGRGRDRRSKSGRGEERGQGKGKGGGAEDDRSNTDINTSPSSTGGGSSFIMRDGRPTFFFESNRSMEIRAGGVLMYRKLPGKQLQILMIRSSKNAYEDIGGKTDIIDASEVHTAAREAEEESNGLLRRELIVDQIRSAVNSSLVCYLKNGKYILYVVEASKEQAALTSEEFGDTELHDCLPRTVHWIDVDKVIGGEVKLHPRLGFGPVGNLLTVLNRLRNVETARGMSSAATESTSTDGIESALTSLSLK